MTKLTLFFLFFSCLAQGVSHQNYLTERYTDSNCWIVKGEVEEVKKERGFYIVTIDNLEVLLGNQITCQSLEVYLRDREIEEYSPRDKWNKYRTAQSWLKRTAIFAIYKDFQTGKLKVNDFGGSRLIPYSNSLYFLDTKEDESYVKSLRELVNIPKEEPDQDWQRYFRAFSENTSQNPSVRLIAADEIALFNYSFGKSNPEEWLKPLMNLRDDPMFPLQLSADRSIQEYTPTSYLWSERRLQFLEQLSESNCVPNDKRLLAKKWLQDAKHKKEASSSKPSKE